MTQYLHQEYYLTLSRYSTNIAKIMNSDSLTMYSVGFLISKEDLASGPGTRLNHSRALPPYEFQTLLSSLGTPKPFFSFLGTLNFLVTCLGIDSLIPPFLVGELCCQGKGVSFSFHNYFLLLRSIIPKLSRQHILLNLILRVSDPGAASNIWSRLWHSYKPGQPFVT